MVTKTYLPTYLWDSSDSSDRIKSSYSNDNIDSSESSESSDSSDNSENFFIPTKNAFFPKKIPDFFLPKKVHQKFNLKLWWNSKTQTAMKLNN